MNPRARVLWLACAAACVLAAPAAAQGLRPTPGLGGGSALWPAPGPAAPAQRPADNTPRQADYIVAVVNSEPITNNEVRMRMQRIEQQLAQQCGPVPPRAQLSRQVLERLISERAQLQLARESGIKVDEAMIDQAELTIARQNQLDVPELRRQLKADGMSLTVFREDLRNQLLLTRLRERELESKVKITELDVDEFLREQKASQENAASELNLAHILIAVPENATEAQVEALRARAQRIQERARAGEDFVRLARENSDAPGAAQTGGVVGLRPADRYPPLFVQATQGLAEGGVSPVVRSGAGFHVIKVVDIRQGSLPGVNVTQSRARHILLRTSPQLTESAARARLADYKRRIEAGQADFATLARLNSQDASGNEGGDLGWTSPGMFVPEFEETLNSLAPGQLSEPFVSRFGVHLVQLLERRETTLSEREQRAVARNLAREKKLDEAYARWAEEVRGRAYVELREPPQ